MFSSIRNSVKSEKRIQFKCQRNYEFVIFQFKTYLDVLFRNNNTSFFIPIKTIWSCFYWNLISRYFWTLLSFLKNVLRIIVAISIAILFHSIWKCKNIKRFKTKNIAASCVANFVKKMSNLIWIPQNDFIGDLFVLFICLRRIKKFGLSVGQKGRQQIVVVRVRLKGRLSLSFRRK